MKKKDNTKMMVIGAGAAVGAAALFMMSKKAQAAPAMVPMQPQPQPTMVTSSPQMAPATTAKSKTKVGKILSKGVSLVKGLFRRKESVNGLGFVEEGFYVENGKLFITDPALYSEVFGEKLNGINGEWM